METQQKIDAHARLNKARYTWLKRGDKVTLTAPNGDVVIVTHPSEYATILEMGILHMELTKDDELH